MMHELANFKFIIYCKAYLIAHIKLLGYTQHLSLDIMERIKNEHIKEIMGVKEKPDIIDIIERKRLQWYDHVKRMQEDRLPKLIMEWISGERRKRGRPIKSYMDGVGAAMKTRHLEEDQWLNRKELCLDSGRRRQLSQNRKDG